MEGICGKVGGEEDADGETDEEEGGRGGGRRK